MEQISPETKPDKDKELIKIEDRVMLINPKNPNFEGVVIGVEITVSDFQGLNLDHHGPNDTSETPSAIEQALTFDISQIPSEGKIATVRPDLDSVGAIAVLLLRMDGKQPDEKLVKAIGLLDRKGPIVFEREGKNILGFSDEEFEEVKKILSAIKYKIMVTRPSLPEAVLFMQKVLLRKVDKEEIEKLYMKNQKLLEEAEKESEVSLHYDGKVVLVKSTHPMAMEIGYRYSDIVIAYNPQFKWPDGTVTPKFTIARRDSNVRWIDLKKLQEELNKISEGKGIKGSWGGQENIIGSPQNEDPQISVEELLEIVGRCLI
jgi:hypothetical protein